MEIKIEKGIPISQSGAGRNKYPFEQMQIGESFALPTDATSRNKLHMATSQYSLRHPGYKFTVRKVNGEVRVWRVPVKGKK